MDINFKNVDEIKKAGFIGFKTIADLHLDNSLIPISKGVYLVLHLNNDMPELLSKGTGGFFKGKNPNVPEHILKANWVNDTNVVYIGKAGSDSSNATLKSRINQYLKFGQGKNIGHYGGRMIWQLKNSKDLIICWKPLTDEDPRAVESKLIHYFTEAYGKRPFANLAN